MRRRQYTAILGASLLALGIGGKTVAAQTPSVAYTYDALGRVTGATYENGASVSYAYDPAGNRTAWSSVAATTPPTPAAPTASAISTTTPQNTAKAITLLPSGNWTSVSISTAPSQGSASLSGTTATYTPTATFVGTDSFAYVATGPGGTSAPATVSVTVTAAPAPTFSATVSQGSWWARRFGTAPLERDPAIAVTPANGTPGYTYAWERVSGDTQISVVPSGATATWSRSLTTIGEWTAVWRCKVTDAAGRVAYTPNVTVTFTRENAG